MKQLEYLYFNIYNYYYRRSDFSSALFFRLQAMYMLSLSAGGWALLLQAAFLRLIKRAWFSSPAVAMSFALSVYLVIGLVFYRIFIIDNHDEKIFHKYEQSWNSNPNKKGVLLLCIFVAIVPYVLLLALSLLFPRQH